MASLTKDARGNLRVKFRVPGSPAPIREPLGLKPTKANLAYGRRLLKMIEDDLTRRDYAALIKRFPDSPRLKKLGHVAPVPVLTLGEFARTVWLAEFAARATQPQKLTTLVGYEGILRRWLEPCPLMGRPLAELSPADGAAFAAWLAKKPGTDAMRNKSLKQLGRILKRARELEYLGSDRDPLLGVENFTSPVNDEQLEGELGAWTVAEREALIEAAYAIAPWQGVATEVAFFTGMRRGETFGLRWSDIDFERGEIRIWRSIRPNSVYPTSPLAELVGSDRLMPGNQAESPPKTPRSRAVIEMLPRVRNALHSQRQRLGLASLWVFPNSRGDAPQQVHNFSKRLWREIVAKADVPYRAFKQTRHTFAVLALEAGGEGQLIWVQRMLRHASSEMLVRHYLKHARPSAPSVEFLNSFEAKGAGVAGPLLGHFTEGLGTKG